MSKMDDMDGGNNEDRVLVAEYVQGCRITHQGGNIVRVEQSNN